MQYRTLVVPTLRTSVIYLPTQYGLPLSRGDGVTFAQVNEVFTSLFTSPAPYIVKTGMSFVHLARGATSVEIVSSLRKRSFVSPADIWRLLTLQFGGLSKERTNIFFVRSNVKKRPVTYYVAITWFDHGPYINQSWLTQNGFCRIGW